MKIPKIIIAALIFIILACWLEMAKNAPDKLDIWVSSLFFGVVFMLSYKRVMEIAGNILDLIIKVDPITVMRRALDEIKRKKTGLLVIKKDIVDNMVKENPSPAMKDIINKFVLKLDENLVQLARLQETVEANIKIQEELIKKSK